MAGSRDAGAVGRRRRLIVTKIFVCFSPLNNGSIGHAVRGDGGQRISEEYCNLSLRCTIN